MKNKEKEDKTSSEMQFELKYCERCGGLWLRRTGEGQVYCGNCAQAMAQLPPPTKEPDIVGGLEDPLWGEFEISEKDGKREMDGGVA